MLLQTFFHGLPLPKGLQIDGLSYRDPEVLMTGREYAAALREAVEFFEAHPYLPVPDTARIFTLYYEHPSPAEIRWLTSIIADEGFTVQSSSAGPDLWVKKLTTATLVLALPPLVSRPC